MFSYASVSLYHYSQVWRASQERKKAEVMRAVKTESATARLELSRDSLAAKGGELLVWGKGTDGQLGIPKCMHSHAM